MLHEKTLYTNINLNIRLKSLAPPKLSFPTLKSEVSPIDLQYQFIRNIQVKHLRYIESTYMKLL